MKPSVNSCEQFSSSPPMRTHIQKHTENCSQLFTRADSDTMSDLWLLADGTVYAGPVETQTAVMQRFMQGATPARQCRTCVRLLRPGLSAGYCGGRADLPPAYGESHPLRQLPDDRGAVCHVWELRP